MRKDRIDSCPICGEQKDKRAELCKSCHLRIKKPRRGTGQWHIAQNGYMTLNKTYLHRIIMENQMGRKLHPNECVHHIDGNPLNNKLENLQKMTKSDHALFHFIPRAKEMSMKAHKARWGYIE